MRILPEHASEESAGPRLLYLKPVESSHEYQIGTSAIALNGVWKELARNVGNGPFKRGKSFQAVESEAPQLLGPVEGGRGIP